MDATLVALASQVNTACSYVASHASFRPILVGTRSLAAQHIPLSDQVSAFYLRRERKDHDRQINVFRDGKKVYTIERKSRFTPIWSILQYPSRREVATAYAGLFTRSVDFHTKKGIQHRDLTGLTRKFYLHDGEYEWSRPTKYLERINNPGGSHEEIRERVARARLMRQFRFDYELLVDENKIDSEIALATAFISMITQWGLGHRTDTTGPTHAISSQFDKPILQQTLIPKHLHVTDKSGPIVENRIFLVMERFNGTRKLQC
jgi:hypothetical protein